MKQYLPLVIAEIKRSYFSKISPEASQEAILFIKELKNDSLYAALKKISAKAKDEEDLNCKNLYHLSWRILETHFVYDFEEGQEVTFKSRKRIIKKIDRKEHKAFMENGDIIHLSLLLVSNVKEVNEQEEVYEQLDIFEVLEELK